MFSSYRNAERSLGYLIAFILALFAFGLWDSQIPDEKAAAYYYQKCAETGGYEPVTPYPVIKQNGPNNSERRGDQGPDWCDLAAQESVAESTRGTKRATWIAVWLTTVGAFLLWRTLLATQETVALTRRIGEAQTRAYLTLGGVHASDADDKPIKAEDKANSCFLGVYIGNTGQTPARICRASYLFLSPDEVESFNVSSVAGFDEKLGDIGGSVNLLFRTDERSNEKWFGEFFTSDMKRNAFVVIYSYQDVFGHTYRGLAAWKYGGPPLVTPNKFSLIRAMEIEVGGPST